MIEIEIWRSRQEFSEHAEEWNQLWQTTRSTVAIHRAEPLLAWYDAFAAEREMAVIVLRNGNQLVAGLPLVMQLNRWGRRIGLSVANEWAPQACWLTSATIAEQSLVNALRNACRQLNLFQVRLDWLPFEWPANSHLMNAWNQTHQYSWVRPRYQVSRVEMANDWDEFRGQWSRNRRKKVQQTDRNLRAMGEVEFVCLENRGAKNLDEVIDSATGIEHQSWKGAEGGSLVSHPNALKYYRTWVQHLHELGLARIYFLHLNGKPIAFDLGYEAQGVYSSIKISYLPEYQSVRPGEWLNIRMLEHFHQTNTVKSIDCIGPVSPATLRWESSRYTVGKLVLSTPSWFSGATVAACQTLSQWLGKNTLQPIAVDESASS